MMKKALSVLICILVMLGIFTVMPFGVSAEESDLAEVGDVTSGTTGDCTWTLSDSVLTISGSGMMGDYDNSAAETRSPWRYKNFTEAVVKNGVTYIGKNALAECYYLKKVTLPDSITNIGERAFHFSTALQSVNIPSSVKRIGEYAFYACHNLEKVNIPEGVMSIDKSTFYSCRSLKSVIIPGGVQYIGKYAFYQCTGIKSAVIPDSVKTIDEYAFNNCPELLRVTVPSSVTSIGSVALGYDGHKKIAGFTIYGEKDSAAEKYAKDNGFTFIEGVAPMFMLGDTDGDGEISIVDATAIQRWLAKLPTKSFNEAAADADSDQEITIGDATAIQRYLAQLSCPDDIGTLIS